MEQKEALKNTKEEDSQSSSVAAPTGSPAPAPIQSAETCSPPSNAKDGVNPLPSSSTTPQVPAAAPSRIVYGKDVPSENDEIQYKWGAIFYNYTPDQRALLALDEVSMYSITDTRSANNTSRILQQLVGERAVVTDGCAAAGGNVLSFAQHFRRVQAVELDPQRFSLLEHNVKALGLEDMVTTFKGDFLEKMHSLQQDVVFLDPPWGGKSYVENDMVDLSFGGVPLAELCERLKPHAHYIALKLPLNFNLEGLTAHVTSSVVRADSRCARKQLLVILDTTGKIHSNLREGGRGGRGRGGGRGGHNRGQDDRPWSLKRKST